MNLEKEAQGFQQATGGSPVSPSVLISSPGIFQDKVFIEKWQDVLSTWGSFEQPTVGVLTTEAPGNEKTSLCPNGNIPVAPQSTGQCDTHCPSLNCFGMLSFEMPASSGLSKKIAVKAGATVAFVACSNQYGDTGGDKHLAAKTLHPQGIEKKHSSPHRPPDDLNRAVRMGLTESSIPVPNGLTELHFDHLEAELGTRERSDHAMANGREISSRPSSDSISEDRALICQMEVKGVLDSSIDSSSRSVIHRTGESADFVPFRVEKELLSQNDLEIQDNVGHLSTSIVESQPGNPMNRVSGVRVEADSISENHSSQILKTSPLQRSPVEIPDKLPRPHAISVSSQTAAHIANNVGTIPDLIGTHEESGTSTYSCPHLSQPSFATPIESMGRSERVNQTVITIDEPAPTSHWTLAGSHRAEAGFQDTSLGWVSVRAQAGASGIHAVVVPSSDAAAQVLNTHLAGLNAHMTSQYEHLNTIALASPDVGSGDRDPAGNSAQHNHRDRNQDEAQNSQENSQSSPSDRPRTIPPPVKRKEMDRVAIPPLTLGLNARQLHFSVIA